MYIEEWLTMLMGDPDSKVAGIATLPGVRPTDLMADMYSCTVLFFEADPTNTTINKAKKLIMDVHISLIHLTRACTNPIVDAPLVFNQINNF